MSGTDAYSHKGTGPETCRLEVCGTDSNTARYNEVIGPDTYRCEVSGTDTHSYKGTGPDIYRLEVSGMEV